MPISERRGGVVTDPARIAELKREADIEFEQYERKHGLGRFAVRNGMELGEVDERYAGRVVVHGQYPDFDYVEVKVSRGAVHNIFVLTPDEARLFATILTGIANETDEVREVRRTNLLLLL